MEAPPPTAAIADACVRLRIPGRVPPLRPVIAGRSVAGPALPVRHAGSVDVFFEAFERAQPGQVLVIDNRGRLDEGCIGDLTALEALHRRLAGIVVDGCHRDTRALRDLGLPVWSRGAFAFGPRLARPRHPDALRSARIGDFRVLPGDLVVADDDGVVFVPGSDAERVVGLARRIQQTEAQQADRARQGEPLSRQLDVAAFLKRRAEEPGYTFREHLRATGRAIEE